MLSVQYLLASVTLNDVRITPTMVMPLLDSVKSVFMWVWPYLLGLASLKLGVWLIPVLYRSVNARKHS